MQETLVPFLGCGVSCVQLFATPWTAAPQAPLSMRLSQQEYWKWVGISSLRDFPNPGIKPASPVSPVLAGRFFTTERLGNP